MVNLGMVDFMFAANFLFHEPLIIDFLYLHRILLDAISLALVA